MDSLLTDLEYALGQLKRLPMATMPCTTRDGVQRALDALGRMHERLCVLAEDAADVPASLCKP